MKRITIGGPSQNGRPRHLAAVESNTFTHLMGLVAHCSETAYEDGSPRQPGWLTVKTEGSSWKVILKDPDACASLTAIGSTLDDALTLADLLVTSHDAPWELDRFLRGNQTKKK